MLSGLQLHAAHYQLWLQVPLDVLQHVGNQIARIPPNFNLHPEASKARQALFAPHLQPLSPQTVRLLGYSICSEAHCPFNVIRCSAKGRRWLKASWVSTWRLQRRLLLGLCSVGARLDQLRVGVYTVTSVRYNCSEWEVDTYHPSDERCSTLHPSSHPTTNCNHTNCACLHTNCRVTAPPSGSLESFVDIP